MTRPLARFPLLSLAVLLILLSSALPALAGAKSGPNSDFTGSNLYRYANNNPVNYTDPTGLNPGINPAMMRGINRDIAARRQRQRAAQANFEQNLPLAFKLLDRLVEKGEHFRPYVDAAKSQIQPEVGVSLVGQLFGANAETTTIGRKIRVSEGSAQDPATLARDMLHEGVHVKQSFWEKIDKVNGEIVPYTIADQNVFDWLVELGDEQRGALLDAYKNRNCR